MITKIILAVILVFYIAAIPLAITTTKTILETFGGNTLRAFLRTWFIMPMFMIKQLFK